MKKIFTLISLLVCFTVIAQDSKWQASIEPQKVFIENKSQFDNRISSSDSKILFATEDASAQILFTKTGLTYRIEKREHVKLNEREEREAREGNMDHKELEEMEHQTLITTDVVTMQWLNANSDVEVTGFDQVSHYYNYKSGSSPIENCKAFEKIVYKNLYPNIDVEYVFHPLTGIEYNFTLHPGADPSQIKMNYSDVSKISFDKQNNIHFKTMFGDIIDHAPKTSYANSTEEIDSKFVLDGKTVSISLADYDQTQEVLIDPWTVTPSFPNSNRIFNIESDSLGNAYIYGGDSPFKLQKYNAAGALQWTFTNGWDSSTYWFGTLIVDRAGNPIITAGTSPEITKLNTTGGQIWTNSGGFVDEYWSMAFNCDETQLIVGGTRLTGLPFINGSGRIYNIDLNNGGVINSVKVSNAVPSFLISDPNEVRSVCASPNGNFYFLTLDTIGSIDAGMGINWERVSGYRFGYGSPNYGFTPQGQSIIRATDTHIYTANGDSIFKRDINTGLVVAARSIPGGGHATTFLIPGTLPRNGGLAIDSCGNVYAGSQTNVSKFDANLNLITSANTPAAVYDVAIGVNGDILACGNGFAAAINMSSCVQVYTVCNTLVIPALQSSDSSICEQTCIDYTDLSLNSPISWEWTFTGAQTTSSTLQNPTGICYNSPGNYDVTLIACNAFGCDTLTFTNFIHVDGIPVISLGNDTMICIGSSVTIDAGSSFTSYLWSNFATTQTITVSAAGTYVVQVHQGDCINTDTIIVTTQSCNNVIVALSSSDTSFCEKNCIDFFDLSTNSPTSWLWLFPGADSTSSTVQNPTGICYNSLGSFDVTLIACNSFGCDTLVFTNFINEYANPVDSIWASNDTLYSLPFSSYQWYDVTLGLIPGATGIFYVPTQPGSFFCVATDSIGCIATSPTIVISGMHQLVNNGSINIQPNPGSGIFTLSGEGLNNKTFAINIYDAKSKLVYHRDAIKIQNTPLDLNALAQGVYSVQLVSKDITHILKLIIEK